MKTTLIAMMLLGMTANSFANSYKCEVSLMSKDSTTPQGMIFTINVDDGIAFFSLGDYQVRFGMFDAMRAFKLFEC